MKIIGITGGIGAGKSAILSLLKEELKCFIILSDEAAHEVKKSGTECFNDLVKLLGKDIIGDDGEINKKLMAEKIFSDKSLLDLTNAIIHPAVKEYILDKIKECDDTNEFDYFFIEAALLIECGYNSIVDEMWYIYASPEVRRKRLKESRGYDDNKIDSIMASQLDDEEFKANSDFIIDNSNSIESSLIQIRQRIK